MFFKAAKAYLQMNPEIDTKFVVVGDGELKKELRSYCQAQGLSAHVIFCGWLKNISYVYADLSILALTSLNEGTPVSIIEAMAASVPVIATNVGGVRDLLGKSDPYQNKNGFSICQRGILCQRNNSKGFAEGIKFITEVQDSNTINRIANARLFAKERYSKNRLIQDVEYLYAELMAH